MATDFAHESWFEDVKQRLKELNESSKTTYHPGELRKSYENRLLETETPQIELPETPKLVRSLEFVVWLASRELLDSSQSKQLSRSLFDAALLEYRSEWNKALSDVAAEHPRLAHVPETITADPEGKLHLALAGLMDNMAFVLLYRESLLNGGFSDNFRSRFAQTCRNLATEVSQASQTLDNPFRSMHGFMVELLEHHLNAHLGTELSGLINFLDKQDAIGYFSRFILDLKYDESRDEAAKAGLKFF